MRSFLLRLVNAPGFVPACFVVFLALRAAILFVPIELDSDALWYFERALGIAAGQGYAEDGLLTAFWPIGYPGFLGTIFSLFGAHQLAGQIANLVLASGTFFLVLALARRLLRNEMAARITVLLLTLYPNNIGYTANLLTEIFFTFLILLGCFLLTWRRGWAVAFLAGLVFGLATLTKPQVLFLPGFLGLLELAARWRDGGRGRVLLRGVVIYLALVCAVAPWSVRNTLLFGHFVPISTNGGYTLVTGNNPTARGDYTTEDPLVPHTSVANQVEVDKEATARALAWIKANPGRFLELVPLKIFRLWAPDGESEWAFQAGYAGYDQYAPVFRAVRFLNQLYYVLLMAGAVVGLCLLPWRPRDWPQAFTPFGLVFALYLTAISVVFSGQSRFHFPVMPWLMMYAAYALAAWSARTVRRDVSSPALAR